MKTSIFETIHTYLNSCVELGYFQGTALVAKKNHILLHKGYGYTNVEHQVPNSSETKYSVGCITKQFTAVAILQLSEKGLLQLDDSLIQYLPQYPHGDKITIHHLLSNSSGIVNHTDLPEYNRFESVSLDHLIHRFMSKPLLYDPGLGFNYSNSNYALLAYIIEKVTDQSFEAYLTDHIFTPLQMNNTGLCRNEMVLDNYALPYTISGEGLISSDYQDMTTTFGSGCLYTTAGDLYLWDRALTEGKVLNQESLQRMFTAYVNIPYMNESYGYGWYVLDQPRKLVSNGGMLYGYRSEMFRYLQEDMTILLLSNLDAAPIMQMIKTIEAILFGEKHELPSAPIPLKISSSLLEKFVGRYESPFMGSFHVTMENRTLYLDRLYIQQCKQQKFEIFPIIQHQDSTVFACKVGADRIRFIENEQGEITQFIYNWDTFSIPAKKI